MESKMEESVKQVVDRLRSALLVIEKECRELRDNVERREKDRLSAAGPAAFGTLEHAYACQREEQVDQSKLAIRAVEDARMRLGKVIQYERDGVSIYDRNEVTQ